MVQLTFFEFLRRLPTPPGAVTQADLISDTAALSNAVRADWERSILGPEQIEATHDRIVRETVVDALSYAELEPPEPIITDLCGIVRELIALEPHLNLPPERPREGLNYAELLAERARLIELRKILDDPEPIISELIGTFVVSVGSMLSGVPKPDERGCQFNTTIIDLSTNVAPKIEAVIELIGARSNALRELGFLNAHADQLWNNLLNASGLSEYEWNHNPKATIKKASDQKNLSPAALVETYLGGTPFADVYNMPWTVSIPEPARFEHHWIVAGSGHGKTQTLQYLIGQDLERVAAGEASIIVIDSQGDLINTIAGLSAFYEGGALENKLCLIDPTDIEYPVALNLFDVGMDRIKRYSPLDRERLINGVIELYDFVLSSLLSAELTQKQGIIFRYITRLMLHIPDANIQTLRQLMEPGASEKFRPYIEKLSGTARAFFEHEFDTRQFEDTKRQVIRRLYGILENQTFERMFSHPRNKLNLFNEMNTGKVILINTAKDLLKQNGTEIFGRFFIALIAQAAQERATLSKDKRLPTFVYIDECQDYMDSNVALILEQARKFNIGMILAHQYVGQLSPKLQESFAANTSIKFAGGVSDKDARQLSHMLRTTPEFLEQQPKGSFAAFIRNSTDHAISLRTPFGFLEQLPRMSDEEAAILRDHIRRLYAVPYQEIEQSISDRLEQPTIDDPDSEARSDAAESWGDKK